MREPVLLILPLSYLPKKNCREEGYTAGVAKNFLLAKWSFCNEEESCKLRSGIEVRETCFDVSVSRFCSGYFK